MKSFSKLVKLNTAKKLAQASRGEQMLYRIVTARCAKDMDGFFSVFDQTFDANEIKLLIEDLRTIQENELADAFERCRKMLVAEEFYEHRDFKKMPSAVWNKIEKIGDGLGDRLWDLDEKLVSLLQVKPN